MASSKSESEPISNLSIRNLTPTTLQLNSVERYAAVTPNLSPATIFTNIAANVTSTLGIRSVRQVSNRLTIAQDVQAFDTQSPNLQIPPFSTVSTEYSIVKDDDEIKRLIFDIEGQLYRADLPLPSGHSNTLFPLVESPRFTIIAIYIPEDALLALFSSFDLTSWMSQIAGSTPLSLISIPGTHNSPTFFTALPSVRCQVVSPKLQLENGIRFLDVRLKPEAPLDASNEGLQLVHGVFPVSIYGARYFRRFIEVVKTFLANHPSEVVVLSVKREGSGEHNDGDLTKILMTHYVQDLDLWYIQADLPVLDHVRGKIVLLRRFSLQESETTSLGIDATNWPFNVISHESENFHVQDLCEVLTPEILEQKIQATQAQLQLAQNSVSPKLYLNFLSASNFWNMGCWPEVVANTVNPAILRYLSAKHGVGKENWATGIVICDWIGDDGNWDIVKAVVGMNSKMVHR